MTVIRKIITVGILLASVGALSGCQDRYRYPCQDPRNWNSAECQKPQCDISKSCPEHIFPEKDACKKDQ
jgi:hypothetical protein